MSELRTIIHELLNALSISRGLSEGVLNSLKGDISLSVEQQISKLERSIKAMDRIEESCKVIRSLEGNANNSESNKS